MDRRDNDQRQSSLPSSLIPHLYAGPSPTRDSGTRTTLPIPDQADDGGTSAPPLPSSPTIMLHPIDTPVTPPRYSPPRGYPPYDAEMRPVSEVHREPPSGRAAPSAFLSRNPPAHTQHRRSDSYYYPPLQQRNPSSPSHYSYQPEQPYHPQPTGLWSEAGPSSQQQQPYQAGPDRNARYTGRLSPLQDATRPPEFYERQEVRRTYRRNSYGYPDDTGFMGERGPPYHSAYEFLPTPRHYEDQGPLPMGEPQRGMSLSTPYSDPHRRPEENQAHRPGPSGRASWPMQDPASSRGRSSRHSRAASRGSVDADDFYDADEGFDSMERPSKRRKQPVKPEETAPKKRASVKKTTIACDFCRGRKLRCDGNRPACWNCISRERERECVYQLVPRRRGPGKRPKRSKESQDRDELSSSRSASTSLTRSLPPSMERPLSRSGEDTERSRRVPSFRPIQRPEDSEQNQMGALNPPYHHPTGPSQGRDSDSDAATRGRPRNTSQRSERQSSPSTGPEQNQQGQ